MAFVTFSGASGSVCHCNVITDSCTMSGIIKGKNNILYISGANLRVNIVPLVKAINCSVSTVTQSEFDAVTDATMIYNK